MDARNKRVRVGQECFSTSSYLLQPHKGRIPLGYYYNNEEVARINEDVTNEKYQVYGFNVEGVWGQRSNYKNAVLDHMLAWRSTNGSYNSSPTFTVQTSRNTYGVIPGGICEFHPRKKLHAISWQWRDDVISAEGWRNKTIYIWMAKDSYKDPSPMKGWLRDIVKMVNTQNMDVEIQLVERRELEKFHWSPIKDLPGMNVNQLRVQVTQSVIASLNT